MTSGRWRALGVAAALVALALAAELFAVALDARAWDRAFRADDVVFRVAPGRARWFPHEREPFGVARRILDVDDDVALRRAIRLFELSRREALEFGPGKPAEAGRARAEIALAEVERTSSTPRDRAVAANLLGLVAFDQARSGVADVGPLLRRSAAAFRRAIVLDPAADDAKENLEVVLRLMPAGAALDRQRVGLFGTAQGPGTGSGRGGGGY